MIDILGWITEQGKWVLPIFHFVVVIAAIKYIFFGK